MLCSLLQRELHQKGLHRSIPNILETLGEIREVAVVYPTVKGGPEPKVAVTLSKLTPHQQAMYDALRLAKHRSKP
jgi:hypothetical protein